MMHRGQKKYYIQCDSFLPHQLHQNLLLCVRWVKGVPTSRPLLQTLADVYRVMSSGPTWDAHTALRLLQVLMAALIYFTLRAPCRYLVT